MYSLRMRMQELKCQNVELSEVYDVFSLLEIAQTRVYELTRFIIFYSKGTSI